MRRTSTRPSGRVKFVIAAAVASATQFAFAQTSGTWIPTGTAGTDWGTATQWIGSIPDGGGTATFLENVTSPPTATPTLSSNYTLSHINIASSASYAIEGAGGITLPGGGGAVNVTRSASNLPVSQNLGTYDFLQGSSINVPISGGALTVSGGGAVALTAANTYVGTTTVNNSILSIAGDSSLGDPGNSISLNSGTLASRGPTAFVSNRNIAVTGNSSLQMGDPTFAFNVMTINGVVSGSGTLSQSVYSSMGVTFTNTNTFSGVLAQRSQTSGVNSAGFVLSGNGAFPSVASIYVDSFINLNNTTTNNSDRIADNATVYLAGAGLDIANARGPGSTSTTTQEVAGVLQNTGGPSIVTLSNVAAAGADPGTQIVFSLTNVTRTNGATLRIRGNLLSDTPATLGSGISNFISTNAPAGLAGGSGGAGSPDLKIVPWMLGGGTAGISAANSSLVTWNASNGCIRPLASDEYATSFGVATNNVLLNSSVGSFTIPGGGATVNSLTLVANAAGAAGGAVVINGTDPVTVSSGAILIKGNATGATINAPIAFPAGVEGIFLAARSFTTTNVISGNNGVTLGSISAWTITGNGVNSTYSGPTTLGGAATISGNLPVNANSAFGNTSSPVILSAGDQAGARLTFSTSSVVDRDIAVVGTGATSTNAVLTSSTGNEIITFNGNLSVNHDLSIGFRYPALTPGVPTVNATFNGIISGSGKILEGVPQVGLAPSAQILNGANSFSGGVVSRYGAFYAGNDSAFGTGTYFTRARSGPFDLNAYPAMGATAGPSGTDLSRTIANNLVLNSDGLTLNNAIPLNLTGMVELNGRQTTLVALGAPTELSGDIVSGGLTVLGGQEVTLSGTNGFTGGVNASASTTLPDGSTPAAGRVRFASPGALPAGSTLAIGAGAIAKAADHGANPRLNLNVSTLTIDGATDAWTGQLDLGNNDMLVVNGSLTDINNQIKTGYNSGAWTGQGISSSNAAVNSNAGLGYAQSGGGTQVRYTLYGDADLNLTVNITDFALLASNFNAPNTVWATGDFNYDNQTGIGDFALLAANFNQMSPRLGATTVPEPALFSTVLLLGMGQIARRRRSRGV